MKRCIALTLTIILLLILCACNLQSEPPSETRTPVEPTSSVRQTEPPQPQSTDEPIFESESGEAENDMTSITVTIGDSVYSADLYDNETAAAFLALLPMTLNMSELNGNEKYYYLPDSLPADSQQVGNINAGDLMLYGSDCLVLFYESFATSYSYTKIGYIENVSGFADEIGGGSVEVTFTVSD